MRFVRYQRGMEGVRFGWLIDDKIGPIEGSIFAEYRRLEPEIPLERVRLLSPAIPGKIIAVGGNYPEHARVDQAAAPDVPLIFLKPPSAVIGPGDPIILPPQSQQVEHEAELAVWIGHKSRWLSARNAMQAVLGYSAANDVTARDLQQLDGQWTRGKGFDTFCPLGPWIETELDPSDALITCRVDGELRQMSSTREMVFSVSQLLVYISSVMTLEPGDVILTGTPAGVGRIQEGSVIEVDIEGIGVLRNPVQSDHTHPA